MSNNVDHHCPGCGTPQRSFERYPWYFCQACLKLACDGDGEPLEFTNASPMGGLVWRHSNEAEWNTTGAVACRIITRPVIVHEARFGGVVAEPLYEVAILDNHTVDLR